MAKTKMLCPFSRELCNECAIYRGRHYYLSLCKQYRGYINQLEDSAKSKTFQPSVNLQAFRQWVEPWAEERNLKIEQDIILKVIDMESGDIRTYKLEETKSWDWSDATTMRIIDGVQITSWEKLVKLVSYKAHQGTREIKLYEAPRFMLLAGG